MPGLPAGIRSAGRCCAGFVRNFTRSFDQTGVFHDEQCVQAMSGVIQPHMRRVGGDQKATCKFFEILNAALIKRQAG